MSDLTYLPLRELWSRLRTDPDRPKPAEWTALHRKVAEPLTATAFALFAVAVTLVTFRRRAPLGFVAVLLAFLTAETAQLTDASVGPGLYFFAGYGLLSIAAGQLMIGFEGSGGAVSVADGQ